MGQEGVTNMLKSTKTRCRIARRVWRLAPVAVLGLAACASPDVTDFSGGILTGAASPMPERKVVSLPGARVTASADTLTTAPLARHEAVSSVGDEADSKFEVVPILWGTNRAVKTFPQGGVGAQYRPISFGNGRGETLLKGVAQVTIPKQRKAFGTIPRPLEVTLLSVSLYRAEEDPRKHFTIGELTLLSDDNFAKFAKQLLSTSSRFSGQCFVYVHGFRNTFEDAVYRAAQMVVDMEFDGAAFVYSWPSQGRVAGYLADRDSADQSHAYFLEFVEFIDQSANCKKIHFVAHSMGTRLLVDTFFPSVGDSPLARLPRVGQIILAAPDIEAGVLKSRAPAIQRSGKSVTLYANGKDEALQWSKSLAGGFQRAGDVVDGRPVVIPGIDTIDLTPMSKSTWFLIGENHNEYAERSHALTDIALLMSSGTRPPDRRFQVFRTQVAAGGTFWQYMSN